jgi:hypothetical protein
VTSALQYALWFLLTFAMVVLWAFGILDIDRHRRRGTSTGAGLLFMAGCVSLVTIVAVAGVGAIFASQWAEAVSKAGPDGLDADEFRGPSRAPVFSFGLENASYGPVSDPVGVEEDQNRAPR